MALQVSNVFTALAFHRLSQESANILQAWHLAQVKTMSTAIQASMRKGASTQM